MKSIVRLSIAALALTACSDARDPVAPAAPARAVSLATSTYTVPFASTLLNPCTGEQVDIAGTQTFSTSDRVTPQGRDFFAMEGVIDGVATSASGAVSSFHQSAKTTAMQSSPDALITGRSSYKFTVEGVDGAPDYVVSVKSDFTLDPNGPFTTTRESVKADCR